VNLPNQLNSFAFNFTPKDIYEDTHDVLDVLITMLDAKGDGQANLVKKMPTDKNFEENLEEQCHLKVDDPSKFYDIVGKLGAGGFAKVFKVRRKSDGLVCALKFMEPKNESERKVILNEIGVMRMCQQNQGVLKVIEAYDFK
jgi:serine/threonine protein kinase